MKWQGPNATTLVSKHIVSQPRATIREISAWSRALRTGLETV